MAGTFTLLGCEEKEEYNKEVDTYTVTSVNKKAKVNFELAKELNYEKGTALGDNSIKLVNKVDLSSITLRLVYDYKNSTTVTKTEKSFFSDQYKDYKEVEIGDFKGWSVWKKTKLVTKYEIELILTDPDSDNKVYAIDINVDQSPLEKGREFDTEEFVNSEDFQHLLNSIEISMPEDKDKKKG